MQHHGSVIVWRPEAAIGRLLALGGADGDWAQGAGHGHRLRRWGFREVRAFHYQDATATARVERAAVDLSKAAEPNVIERRGSHHIYSELAVGQGREAAKAYLEVHTGH